MLDTFRITAGSVPGTDHTKPGLPVWKNNQDAHHFFHGPNVLVGVVCDGCGGADDGNGFSEFGARVGVHLVAKHVTKLIELSVPLSDESFFACLADRIQEDLRLIAELSTSSRLARDTFIFQHLLFTIVGVIITEETTIVFSFGDGVYAVNGDVSVIPPFPKNMPPYIAYRLINYETVERDTLQFVVRAQLPTEEVQSLLIGSDGMADFIAMAEKPLPPPLQKSMLGPLSQFWDSPSFSLNPDSIRRRLAIANREHTDNGAIRGGLLHDDTTCVLITREPKGE